MYRPDNWEGNPCDGCPQKEEDSYGLFCDLACGKHSAYINKEDGADAMLVALRVAGFHITIGQILEIEGKKIKVTKNQTLALIPDEA